MNILLPPLSTEQPLNHVYKATKSLPGDRSLKHLTPAEHIVMRIPGLACSKAPQRAEPALQHVYAAAEASSVHYAIREYRPVPQ